MKIPKVPCECGCVNWELLDNAHECKKCETKISTDEMLEKLNALISGKNGVLKNAG